MFESQRFLGIWQKYEHKYEQKYVLEDSTMVEIFRNIQQ